MNVLNQRHQRSNVSKRVSTMTIASVFRGIKLWSPSMKATLT